LGHVLLLALYQVPERLPDVSVFFNEVSEYLFNSIQDSSVDRNHWLRGGDDMEDTLLFDSDAYGAYKETTTKEMIISKEKNKKYCFTHLLLCTHLSQRLTPPILTTASPRYFPSCFPLVLL